MTAVPLTCEWRNTQVPHTKGQIKGNRKQTLSPRRLFSLLAYYKWLNSQVITADVPFSDIYSRMQVSETGNSSKFEINFDEHDLEMNAPSDPQILFEFDDIDFSRIEQFLLDNPQIMEEFAIEDMAKSHFTTWKRQSKKLLAREHKNNRLFRKHLNESWRKALVLLEILISTSREKAEEFYNTHHATIAKEDAIVLSLARRLFARAIQISLEIHVLLTHGFADGAEARWRTLYETMVICTFIMRSGYKTAIRYIAHEAVETYKAIQMHSDEHKRNGSIFIPDEELAEIKKRSDEFLGIFGNDFKHDYAWAALALPQIKGNIRFVDLEQFTDYSYLRPVYKDASGTVHASSRSNFDSLASPYNGRSIVISGPSVFGIGEVTRNTAFTILILLENYLSAHQSTQNQLHVSAMYELLNELNEACVRTDRELEIMASSWPEETKSEQDFLSFSVDDLK
jgi:hypothetical protein